jgi:hypothetical protein
MEAIRQDNPPAYDHHPPESLVLPSVPNHTLPQSAAPVSLPDLKSLKLPSSRPAPAPLSLLPQPQWQYGSPSYRQPLHSAGFPSSTLPPPSPMETDTVMSDGGRRRAPSIMSLDDPETREAAETLSGLRNMGMCDSV